ncbi:ABC transporter substrate-binding protein [Gulosibacter sp. ACHW.36C]|uniref:ABC transporter substrate-binding protein n=1 Tax=Gulosibacter sediminis TaxID=1729695 RepID=A0ABY4MZV0_9MICO|nr:ABC transporter substrate-binding protein [Gulosibacter sediminis]UQN14906.1 ABC transporter substrate-binding protein [Gulosibacter sediminis]
MRNKLSRLAAGLTVAALGIGLAGCADSGSASQANSGDATVIAVAGLTNLHNIPLVLADELGYFEEEGVNVQLSDLQSGTKALEAVESGSAPIAASFYDHTLRMQSKGRGYTSFVVLSDSPGAVLATPPSSSGEVTSIADLKGQPVGIAAPGSAEQAYFEQALQENGMELSDVSLVTTGTGSSAVAAMEGGQVVAGWMFEPAFSQFEERNDGTGILIDTRTHEGTTELFGEGGYAAETLYTKNEWLQANPDTAQAIVNATVRAIKWMHEHTAEEIAEAMPQDLIGDDFDSYVDVLDKNLEIYTDDGLMPEGGYEANVQLLESAEGLTDLRPTETFTNEYAEKANEASE